MANDYIGGISFTGDEMYIHEYQTSKHQSVNEGQEQFPFLVNVSTQESQANSQYVEKCGRFLINKYSLPKGLVSTKKEHENNNSK